jgi:hypothetical protein
MISRLVDRGLTVDPHEDGVFGGLASRFEEVEEEVPAISDVEISSSSDVLDY